MEIEHIISMLTIHGLDMCNLFISENAESTEDNFKYFSDKINRTDLYAGSCFEYYDMMKWLFSTTGSEPLEIDPLDIDILISQPRIICLELELHHFNIIISDSKIYISDYFPEAVKDIPYLRNGVSTSLYTREITLQTYMALIISIQGSDLGVLRRIIGYARYCSKDIQQEDIVNDTVRVTIETERSLSYKIEIFDIDTVSFEEMIHVFEESICEISNRDKKIEYCAEETLECIKSTYGKFIRS